MSIAFRIRNPVWYKKIFRMLQLEAPRDFKIPIKLLRTTIITNNTEPILTIPISIINNIIISTLVSKNPSQEKMSLSESKIEILCNRTPCSFGFSSAKSLTSCSTFSSDFQLLICISNPETNSVFPLFRSPKSQSSCTFLKGKNNLLVNFIYPRLEDPWTVKRCISDLFSRKKLQHHLRL